MNSLTFAGWVGDDVLRVLKTHVPVALQGIEKTEDPVKMQEYVVKMKEQIRSSKFKSLNIKLVGNLYILYIGKSIEHTADSISVSEIPNKLIEDCINYISHIKDGKIGRTKYPVMHNILYSKTLGGSDKVVTPKSIPKNGTKVSLDSDEDSLDKTEAINNIIRKKTPKNVEPEPPKSRELPSKKDDDDIEYSHVDVSKNTRNAQTSSNTSNGKSPVKKPVNEDDDIEYSNVEIAEKNVKFEDEIVEPTDDQELVENPKSSARESKKEDKQQKAPETPEKPAETVSRKQRRKQLVDDAEESRWEGLN